jgi:acetyltransferase-like isoleucine patch superfamily enzyme
MRAVVNRLWPGRRSPSTTELHRVDAEERGLLSMGEHSYGWPLVHHYPGEHGVVRIGKFCSIAAKASFFTGGLHNFHWVSTFPFRIHFDLPGAFEDGQPTTRGDIEVGNDVWIGYRATILSGVRIGDGAVIGANATVTKDVRPYAIVAGNPAVEIRRRFPDEQVERLLELAWWDWPLEKILSRVPELCSPAVDDLLNENLAHAPEVEGVS